MASAPVSPIGGVGRHVALSPLPQNRGCLVLLGRGQRIVGGDGQIAGGAIALLGFLAMPLAITSSKAGGTIPGRSWLGRGTGSQQMRGNQPFHAVGAIWRRPGQALAQHAGQRIDVGAVGDLVAGESLRGHVVVGSHGRPDLGQPRVGGGADDTEIHQIGEVAAGDQDVLRFDIAMCHAGGVRGVQRGGDLADDGHRPRRGQRTVCRSMLRSEMPSIRRMSK